jgi:hypothetical protein
MPVNFISACGINTQYLKTNIIYRTVQEDSAQIEIINAVIRRL